MSLSIEERTDSGWLVMAVQGDLDLYTAADLRSLLSDALGTAAAGTTGAARGGSVDGRLHGLVVDLADVTFMDSAGLGVLVWAYKRALAKETHIQLAAPQPMVTKLFQITGLSRVFTVQPSVAAAVHSDA